MFRLLSILILFTASAWANPLETQVSPTPATLKVGVILPLSGGWASWGQRIREGIELSTERFGHPVEFSFDDEGTCEVKKGILAARKFFFEDIKVLVVGCVATIKALLPEAKKRGVIIFAAGLLDRESFSYGASVISLATQVGTEATALANYIEGKGYKSAAFIRPQEAFGEELASVLNTELSQKKIKVLFDDSDSFSTNDFTASILKIKRDKPEVVVINLGESQQLAFMKALRDSGSTVPILSTYGLESNSTSSENIRSLEGISYTYPFNSASESSDKLSFDRRFAQKFGEDKKPNANVYFVSDGLSFLDHALNKCAGADTVCIFDYFTKLGSVEGLSGTVTFRSDGSTNRPYKMKRVVNGEFTWLK